MTKKMWGGRFKKEQDSLFWKFQASLDYDKALAPYDVRGSIAHVKMLDKCSIIPHKHAQAIVNGLSQILKDIEAGRFQPDAKAEDIHTAVYAALKKKIADKADYVHTARSRNDQVVLDMRMYCKDIIDEISLLARRLQSSLVDFAKDNIDTLIPGMTHTQHAMAVLLSHQVLAYVNMLERDKSRLVHAKELCDEMPLGSCALAGTSLAIDRGYVAKLLGFSRVSANSIDAVSDRDFILEILFSLAMILMHLSRLCEDLILFSTAEFGFIDIAEEFCTGSSIMPHKKNPDSLELIRASTGKAYANLLSVLVVMKGLPMSYNRDMQLDKEPLFSSADTAKAALSIMSGIVKTAKVNKARTADIMKNDESLFALDMADYLVRKGLPFSQAHSVVGRLIAYALSSDTKISSMPIEQFKKFSGIFEKDVYAIFDVKRSVMLKKSIGSTNPLLVRQQIEGWRKKLK